MVFLAYPQDLQAQPLGSFLCCCSCTSPVLAAPVHRQECERRCWAGMKGMRPLARTCRQKWDRQMAVYFLEKCLEFRELVSNPLLYKHGSAVPGVWQGQARWVPPAQRMALQGICNK